MNRSVFLWAPMVFLALLVACGGSNQGSARVTDVYVAGSESDGSHFVATYWLNGVAVRQGDGTHSTYAKAVAVAGSDVFVAGQEHAVLQHPHPIAKVWRNGVATDLTDGTHDVQVTSIFVQAH